MVKAVYQNTAIIEVQMSPAATPNRSRVPWALAVTVGLCSGLAGYVIHAARVNRIPKQVVTVKRLTDMPGSEESPTISPDGKAVAFVAMSGGKRQIWVEPVDGGAPRAVTQDDADHYGPRWTPDSKGLIYCAAGAIWEIPATGGESRRLVDAVAPGDMSHDGKLAFFRRGDRGVELMVDARPIATLTGRGSYSNLRWSPDDNKIAFLEDMKAMVVSASGGEPVRAADLAVQGFTWAPDNSGLIVSSRGELWFIPRKEGSSPSQLTFGELSYESPDMSAGGSLVVSRRGLSGQGSDADIVMFSGLKW
jgi:Tol biopolymer transport system component